MSGKPWKVRYLYFTFGWFLCWIKIPCFTKYIVLDPGGVLRRSFPDIIELLRQKRIKNKVDAVDDMFPEIDEDVGATSKFLKEIDYVNPNIVEAPVSLELHHCIY